MAELKTKPTEQSVEGFLRGVSPEQKRQDCLAMVKLMREMTGSEPRMWGNNMVGFGSYHFAAKGAIGVRLFAALEV